MHVRVAGLVVLASTLGCTIDIGSDLVEGATIECEVDTDCPQGLSCVSSLGRCFTSAAPCVEVSGDSLVATTDGNRCALDSGDGICLGGACVESVCGDGFPDVTGGESCDDGTNNNDFSPDACRVACELPRCGDMVQDTGEVCDDGNNADGDGCRGDCQKLEVCGDSTPDAGEACDDGNTVGGDGCAADCSKQEVCGDTTIDDGEVCDDGNAVSGDGCRGDCGKIELCGDALLDEGEACDDGNLNPNDGCDGCQNTMWTSATLFGAGGSTAGSAGFATPQGIAVDANGNVYVSDEPNHRVWRIDAASGRVTLVAGTGQFGTSGIGGPATSAQIWGPRGLHADSRGNLFIAETGSDRVTRVDSRTGDMSLVAGNGTACNDPVGTDLCGDGGLAVVAKLGNPSAVVSDSMGNIYIAGDQSDRIRRVDATTGIITTVVGDGNQCNPTTDPCGDSGAATAAQLRNPRALTLSGSGTLYIASWGSHRIRAVNLAEGTPTISTVAGDGNFCSDSTAPCGDGGAATSAMFFSPIGLALVGDLLYVSDERLRRLRVIDLSLGTPDITTVAGNGEGCPSGTSACGDGGPPLAAMFGDPSGNQNRGMGSIVAGPSGRIIIADQGNHRVRFFDPGNMEVGTLAGSGQNGDIGDGGAATSGSYMSIRGSATDSLGNIYFADLLANLVRRVDAATGVVSTFAGNGGTCGDSTSDCGDGGPAADAPLTFPIDVAIDSSDNVYIADRLNRKIRRVDPAGIITTVVGTGVNCSTAVAVDDCGDGGAATSASLGLINAVDVAGTQLLIAQGGSPRIRRVDLSETTPSISNVVGDGTTCAMETDPCGTGGLATAAQISSPGQMALDGSGALIFHDSSLQRVFRVDLNAMMPTMDLVAGETDSMVCGICAEPCGEGGLAVDACIQPRGLVIEGDGDIIISERNIRRLRRIYLDTSDSMVKIQTIAGTGANTYGGDGGLASTADVRDPTYLSMDPAGTILIGDEGQRLRRIDGTSGIISSVTGVDPRTDGPFSAARLQEPLAMSALSSDAFAVADGVSERLRLFSLASGTLQTIAGYPDGAALSDGEIVRYVEPLATAAGLAYDPTAGFLYVSLRGAHQIGRIDLVDAADPLTWTWEDLAGSGSSGLPTLDPDPLPSVLSSPTGLAFDSGNGVLYFADTGSHTIRAVDLGNSNVSLVAGELGVPGYVGDATGGVDALSARFDGPTALALAPSADMPTHMYIADTGNNRVRLLDLGTGVLVDVLGDGIPASSGTGAPARLFSVDTPRGMAVDSFGNVFVTSRLAIRLIAAGPDNLATGDDVVSTVYGASNSTVFPESVTRCLADVALATDSRALTVDSCLGLAVTLDRVSVP